MGLIGLLFAVKAQAQIDPPPMILGSQARIDVEAEIMMRHFLESSPRLPDDGSLSFVVDFFARNPQLDLSLFTSDSKKAKSWADTIADFNRRLADLESDKQISHTDFRTEKSELVMETIQTMSELFNNEELAKWKQKAVSDIEQHLTDDQRERLAKLLAIDELKGIADETNIETLALEYSYRSKTIPGVDNSNVVAMDEPEEMRQKLKEFIRKQHQEKIALWRKIDLRRVLSRLGIPLRSLRSDGTLAFGAIEQLLQALAKLRRETTRPFGIDQSDSNHVTEMGPILVSP